MPIYVDTEFTSFTTPHLIAIGAVAANGDSFYGVATDYSIRSCTLFVREQVLPFLKSDVADAVGSREDIARAFRYWIEGFLTPKVDIIVDDEYDVHLVHACLGTFYIDQILISILGDSANREARSTFDHFFKVNPRARRHNALDDARALRYALTRPA